MKANKDHISLETAKLLKNCGIVSKTYFVLTDKGIVRLADNIGGRLYAHDDNFAGIKLTMYPTYPAFTWQEILWEYPKEFFGIYTSCFEYDKEPIYQYIDHNYYEPIFDFDSIIHPIQIMQLLQQKKYDEADLYFREHCILINKK